VFNRLKEQSTYAFEPRGQVKIQGIGLVNSYFLGPALQKTVTLPKVSLDMNHDSGKTFPTPKVSLHSSEIKNNIVERAISSPTTSLAHVVGEKDKFKKIRDREVSSSHLPKIS
jgi:hypothetical protein